jgi:glycosyltransferase involved in cell wall biosynthesis
MVDKITLITVTRNDLPGLLMTYQSVCRQSVKPYEYVVLDGGSDDAVLSDALAAIDASKFIIGGPDQGVYDGMNKAVNQATGDWILFLNSGDCLAEVTTLEELIEIDTSSASVVYGGNRVRTESGSVWGRDPGGLGSFKRGMPFCHQSVLVRRELLLECPFSVGLINSDYEFFCRLFMCGHEFLRVDIKISEILAGGISDKYRLRKLREDVFVLKGLRNYNWCDRLHYGQQTVIEMFKWLIKSILPHRVSNRLHSFLKNC